MNKLVRFTAFAFLAIILIPAIGCRNTAQNNNPANKIVLAFQVNPQFAYQQPANIRLRDRFEIHYRPVNCIDCGSGGMTAISHVDNGYTKFILNTSEALQINYGFGQLFIVSPGDSIHIFYDGAETVFSGQGAEKITAWKKATVVEKRLPRPIKNRFSINSLNDYLAWDHYADNKIAGQLTTIAPYANKMDPDEYQYLKSIIIGAAERERTHAFVSLVQHVHDADSLTDPIDLNTIFDSTQYKTWGNWLRSQPVYYGNIHSLYTFNRIEVQRQFNFDPSNDSITNKEARTWLYYNWAKSKYRGALREQLLAHILDEPTITEMGISHPMTQKLLADYYSQPGFPKYKKYVKKLEKKAK